MYQTGPQPGGSRRKTQSDKDKFPGLEAKDEKQIWDALTSDNLVAGKLQAVASYMSMRVYVMI